MNLSLNMTVFDRLKIFRWIVTKYIDFIDLQNLIQLHFKIDRRFIAKTKSRYQFNWDTVYLFTLNNLMCIPARKRFNASFHKRLAFIEFASSW